MHIPYIDRIIKGLLPKVKAMCPRPLGNSFLRLDRYIMRLFLGTYFASIFLILSVAIVFDINERISKFLNPECSLYEIVFHYYLNFVPYYANMFSPLFVFLTVIFFTSKLAEKTEIVAILASGVSFNRFLRPYLFSAGIIALLTFVLSSFVIPPGSAIRNNFQNKYFREKRQTYAESVQIQVSPKLFAYIHSYSADTKTGYNFTLDKFDRNTLKSRLTAQSIEYDTLKRWHLYDYSITHYGVRRDTLVRGAQLDTVINLQPQDFLISAVDAETYTTPTLHRYIGELKSRGATNVSLLEVELHKRYAAIPAAFILTLIGVSLSSKKRKGGMGLSLAIGIALSFTYILLLTLSSSFAISGELPPVIATQLPNMGYAVIAAFLYRRAPR